MNPAEFDAAMRVAADKIRPVFESPEFGRRISEYMDELKAQRTVEDEQEEKEREAEMDRQAQAEIDQAIAEGEAELSRREDEWDDPEQDWREDVEAQSDAEPTEEDW